MATHHPDDEATISIPSLLFVGILLFFSYRYFFARGSGDSATSSSSSSTARAGQHGLRFTAAQVEQVSAMFPQLNRRDIMWDLHRNRGSVQATAERVMAGVGLDPAPPSFQPPITFTTTSSTPAAAGGSQAKKQEVDLITRYNLQSKISGKGKEKEDETPAPGWQQDKAERAKMLQRRRDEMILAARRKMLERDAATGGAGADADAGSAASGS